eukprot:m.369339 g.369339  ORF g.369339 m.369339 type:complete len:386 (-) comp20849_c0_seq6:189-1346(-)
MAIRNDSVPKGVPPTSVISFVALAFLVGMQVGRFLYDADQDSSGRMYTYDQMETKNVPDPLEKVELHNPPDRNDRAEMVGFTSVVRTTPPSAFTPFNKIPNILWFSYKINLWNRSRYKSWRPFEQRLADNVQHIVKMHPNTQVEFLDDIGCERAIATISRYSAADIGILLRGFQNEKDGSMKGDLCRGAALLNSGGYYFDVDIYPVADVRTALSQFTEFVSCYGARRQVGNEPSKEVFQAFIGAEPQHPIIREYVNKIRVHYSKDAPKQAMGVVAMAQALRAYMRLKKSANIYMFQEENLNTMASADLKTPVGDAAAVAKLGREAPRIGGAGAFCDYVVYDPKRVTLLFYSRVPGASKMCYDRDKHFLADSNDTGSIKDSARQGT